MKIEEASDYYLTSMLEDDGIFYVGDAEELKKVRKILKDTNIIATAGINKRVCYIYVDLPVQEIRRIIKDA